MAELQEVNDDVAREMFEERSRALQLWEDLSGEGFEATLRAIKNRERGRLTFKLTLNEGSPDVALDLADKRGFYGTISGYGIELRPRREDEER